MIVLLLCAVTAALFIVFLFVVIELHSRSDLCFSQDVVIIPQ